MRDAATPAAKGTAAFGIEKPKAHARWHLCLLYNINKLKLTGIDISHGLPLTAQAKPWILTSDRSYLMGCILGFTLPPDTAETGTWKQKRPLTHFKHRIGL